jgi:hypothetical protein
MLQQTMGKISDVTAFQKYQKQDWGKTFSMNQVFFGNRCILPLASRTYLKVCQIFLGTTYQNGGNVPNDHKMYQKATKYTKWSRKLMKYTKSFHSKAFQNIPKFGAVFFKYTISHKSTSITFLGKIKL